VPRYALLIAGQVEAIDDLRHEPGKVPLRQPLVDRWSRRKPVVRSVGRKLAGEMFRRRARIYVTILMWNQPGRKPQVRQAARATRSLIALLAASAGRYRGHRRPGFYLVRALDRRLRVVFLRQGRPLREGTGGQAAGGATKRDEQRRSRQPHGVHHRPTRLNVDQSLLNAAG